jgi:hypothetical protein
MGRPPIGKAAMTGAERVRRHRLGRSHAKPVTKLETPVTKHPLPHDKQPDEWDVGEALAVWHKWATDSDREEFAYQIGLADLLDLIHAAADAEQNRHSLEEWATVFLEEECNFVRLPDGTNQYELDKWLREKTGKGLDES